MTRTCVAGAIALLLASPVSAAPLVTLPPVPRPAAADDLGGVLLRNDERAPSAAQDVTFGHVFLPGQVPAPHLVAARIDGRAVPAQLDVKTSYPDGSARMAVVTLPAPPLRAGGSAPVMLTRAGGQGAAAQPLAPRPSGLIVEIRLRAPGGAARTIRIDADDPRYGAPAAASGADANGAAARGSGEWLHGPLARERRVEAPVAGSLRLVIDLRSYADGTRQADLAFSNDIAFGPEGGAVQYDVTVQQDGRSVLQASNVRQFQYQVWHKRVGQRADAVRVVHDVDALARAGAIPNYDLTTGIDADVLGGEEQAMRAPDWNTPLSPRGITRDMPATGGRDDIGPLTKANAVWLVTQDATAERFALGQAEAAGSVPWHFWDAAQHSWISLAAHPKVWTDGRGGQGGTTGLTQQVDPASGWQLDAAHQPNLSYAAYLLTGRRSLKDELDAQAAWAIAAHWPDPRQEGRGLVVRGNQVRGAAWSLRQIVLSAWIDPDGSPEKAYFSGIADSNWSWMLENIPRWTTEQGEVHGQLPGDYGDSGAMAPWQQDYLASTVGWAAALGVPQAGKFLAWQSNFLVGRFRQGARGFPPYEGIAYNLMAAPSQGAPPFKTWAEIERASARAGMSNTKGWKGIGGNFGQLGLQSLAWVYNVLRQPEALATYEEVLRAGPTYTDRATFARDPTFDIVPRRADRAGRG